MRKEQHWGKKCKISIKMGTRLSVLFVFITSKVSWGWVVVMVVMAVMAVRCCDWVMVDACLKEHFSHPLSLIFRWDQILCCVLVWSCSVFHTGERNTSAVKCFPPGHLPHNIESVRTEKHGGSSLTTSNLVYFPNAECEGDGLKIWK